MVNIQNSFFFFAPIAPIDSSRGESVLYELFQIAYRYELEIKPSPKPWRQEIANTSDWPRRNAVAEFRL
jgi:hypothetical protein